MQRVVATQELRPCTCSDTRVWRPRRSSGQAIVEFAIASTLFFLLIFGTIDFGRSIYMYAELRNSVREGARFASITYGSPPSDLSTQQIQDLITGYTVKKSPGLGLTESEIHVTCKDASGTSVTCGPSLSGGSVAVSATLGFQAITQRFLGIGPVTMKAAATDTIE